jgi:hypothetical protein
MSEDNCGISDRLLDVVEESVEHAFKSLDGGGPLIPFVIRLSEGELYLERAVSQVDRGRIDIGASAAMAKTMGRSQPCEVVAVTVDGRIRGEDGSKQDAILVEAFEDGTAESVTFAVQYRVTGLTRKAKPTGVLTLVARGEPFWT